MSASATPPESDRAKMNFAPVEWPLRFESHSFSAFCYDTYGCKVRYANRWQALDEDNELSLPSSTYGQNYMDHLSGGHGMIRNFPPPAKVSWRSKDGEAHEAEIDIGEIFEDELIRHNVPREEMAELPGGEYEHEPLILLEVNDRTIRVYMKAHVALKKEIEINGNLYNDSRDDLILVETYTY